MTRQVSYTTPRQADSGLHYVRRSVSEDDGEVTTELLYDDTGHLRLFAHAADAWEAAMAWKRQTESEEKQP